MTINFRGMYFRDSQDLKAWKDGEFELWFMNDEGLYLYAKDCKDGRQLWKRLHRDGMKTIQGIYASKERCNNVMSRLSYE